MSLRGFYDQVMGSSTPRESKSEIVEYYQAEYGDEWKTHLVNDLKPHAPLTRKESLARRFAADRIEKEGGFLTKRQYRSLGKDLPPIPPEGGFSIKGTIYVKYSDECVERDVDEVVSGDDAKALVREAQAGMLQKLINYYQHGDTSRQGPGAGECEEPDLHVEAIE